jgi:large subunit ribosomal protein L19
MLANKIKFSPVDIEARRALDFKAGDTVRVWSKIAEEKISTKANKKDEKIIKYRTQAFEGTVLARKHGGEAGATFTVRRIASGVGVERIFPLFSPMVDKIEITKKSRTRRSKLYYIRTKAVKDVRRKMRSVTSETDGGEVVEEVK